MRKKMKQLMGILLILVMGLGLVPGMSLTALAWDGDPYADYDVTTPANREKSGEELKALQVKFNEKSWYIIADNSTAVDAGTVTLLAAESFGMSKFHDSSNKYSTSTVKTTLDNMTASGGSFAGVASAINTVKVKGSDSDTEVDAKLYLLNITEAENVPENVLKISVFWWLRSQGFNDNTAACVMGESAGIDDNGIPVISPLYVRPALKLNLSSVIFSSVNLSGAANATASGGSIIQNYFDVGTTRSSMTAVTYTANNGYKFPETSDYYTTTNGIKVERTSDTVVTVSGTPDGVANITVPDAVHFHSFTYSASGAGITATCGNNGCGLTDSKATLVIDAPTMTTYGQTGEGISEATLNGLEAFNTATGLSVSSESILYYKATKIDTTYTKSGNALSAAPTDAGDYLAEITLSGVKTSAGENQSVTASVGYSIAQATPTITTAPTAGEITYGQTLADSTLTGGTATGVDSAALAGSFAWTTDSTAPTVAQSGNNFEVTFTPTDSANYESRTCNVAVTVNKAAPQVTLPTANSLVYTGSAQELISAGSTDDGTMWYALGENSSVAPQSDWSESVPAETEAGTYYVWYKVIGDDNHANIDPCPVEVTIRKRSSRTYCTVTFDMRGHGTAIPSQRVLRGTKAKKPADPEAEGYTFGGWFTDEACSSACDFALPVNRSFTLYAKWIDAQYTVSFNLNGKTAEPAPAPQTMAYGGCAERPGQDPVAEGFIFTGWYTEAACGNVYDFSTPVTDNITLYAGWREAKKCSVSFDMNGKTATDVPETQQVEEGKCAIEPAVAPKAEGYKFAGWYKEKECQTKYDFATPVTEDITLYAGWESGEPVIIETGSDWNLYEDASVHEFKIRGINVSGSVANSNAKSKAYYDANISGSTITVKVTGDRERAASNATLEFDLGNAGVATYVLPVSYVKPSFKLSSTTATIKSGTETVLKTTILTKNSDGICEPYDMTDVKVSGTGLGTVTKAADGSIEIKTNAAGTGKISIVKDAWDGAKPVSLAYTVKGSKKDVLSVDLMGLKAVVVNSNAKGQGFSFDMMLNGSVSADGAVKIVDKKNTGLATIGEGGKLLIAYKDGVKNGTYTITLQAGEAKTNVKIKVSGKELSKAVTAKVQTKYDVVTRQGMVIVPSLKDVSGTIEAVSVAESGFTARLNTAGNIVVDYTGDKYNSKNLNIGTLTLSLKLNGIDEPVKLTLNKVKAKKTTPRVKVGTVTIPKDAAAAEGKVIGTANIVSTYKVSSGTYKTINPVKTEIVGTPKNVTAKPNESDMTEIDIYRISKKNVSFKVKLTYAGGVTKTVTVKVKKK